MNRLFILAGLGAAVWWFTTQKKDPGPPGLVPRAAAMPPGAGLGGLYPGGWAQEKAHREFNIERHRAGLPTMNREQYLAFVATLGDPAGAIIGDIPLVPEGPPLVGQMP